MPANLAQPSFPSLLSSLSLAASFFSQCAYTLLFPKVRNNVRMRRALYRASSLLQSSTEGTVNPNESRSLRCLLLRAAPSVTRSPCDAQLELGLSRAKLGIILDPVPRNMCLFPRDASPAASGIDQEFLSSTSSRARDIAFGTPSGIKIPAPLHTSC